MSASATLTRPAATPRPAAEPQPSPQPQVREPTARALPAEPAASPSERRRQLIRRLERLTPAERLHACRHELSAHERSIYAAHFPEEVPLVNGELEWIALTLADLD